MNDSIITSKDIFDALLGDFEVLMIRKKITNKFGISCVEMSDMPFEDIKAIAEAEDDPNVIFVKTEKYVKEEGKENE